MENLPFLFLKELFGMMPDLNQVIRFSHVCRNWKAAYETMVKPETLCLHFEKTKRTIPLNHRLFYTNDRVSQLFFLKTSLPSNELRFFDSASASTHFANIRKLVIFAAPADYYNISASADYPYKFCLQKQLNTFKRLEYAEFFFTIHVQEACEIDLPFLKIVCFNGCQIDGESAQIILNTPSLEAMKIHTGDRKKSIKITNFKFLFPSALRHLELTIFKTNFKFETKFDRLEVLMFSNLVWELICDFDETKKLQMLADDFLEPLPSLKFLLFVHGWPVLAKLEEEKRKFGLNDLKILTDVTDKFNYANWQGYLEHKEQLRYWPGKFNLVYDKLINCQIPLDLFRENYFRINEMMVCHVDNQTVLLEFLKNAQITSLELKYGCNLGQSFIDQIADSTILLNRLSLDDCILNRMNDFSVLSRLGTSRFTVFFQKFRTDAIIAILKNPICFIFHFIYYDGFTDVNWNGESRKNANIDYNSSHYLQRAGKEFLCNTCGWISSNDPNRFRGPVKVTLLHAANGPFAPNLTDDQRRRYFPL